MLLMVGVDSTWFFRIFEDYIISRWNLHVIVDGQNRETNNEMWYEGELKR